MAVRVTKRRLRTSGVIAALCLVTAAQPGSAQRSADESIAQAAALVEDDQLGGAVELLTAAADAFPRHAELQYQLGRVLRARLNDAGLLARRGLGSRMRSAFEQAVKIDPRHGEARAALANFFYYAPRLGGGSRDKARAQVAALADFDPGRAALLRGAFLLSDADTVNAMEALATARQLAPTLATAHFRAGLVYVAQGDFQAGIVALRQAVVHDPEQQDALYHIGRASALGGIALVDGLEALTGFLAADPPDGDRAWAYLRRGQIQTQLGQLEQARGAFEEALRLDPDLSEAREALGSL